MLDTMRRFALLAVLAVAAAGCGGHSSATPSDDPGTFAVGVVTLITHNHYATAWGDLHPDDQKVAPLAEYVGCEARSPVLTAPTSMKVVSITDESVGLGNGRFVASKAVHVRIVFPGPNLSLLHTVHVVAESGKWKWILPSWRFRDYKADRCPTDAGSAPPPASA
jgi:hypothetical protein